MEGTHLEDEQNGLAIHGSSRQSIMVNHIANFVSITQVDIRCAIEGDQTVKLSARVYVLDKPLTLLSWITR